MKDVNHSGFCSQVPVIFSKLCQCLPCSIKQGIINDLRLMHCQHVQLKRQSKHHVKIFYWKEFFLSLLYPFFTQCSLTFGAMAVPATVLADAYCSARGTCIYVSAHGSSSATHDCTQGSKLPWVDSRMHFYLRPMSVQDIGHLKNRLQNSYFLWR